MYLFYLYLMGQSLITDFVTSVGGGGEEKEVKECAVFYRTLQFLMTAVVAHFCFCQLFLNDIFLFFLYLGFDIHISQKCEET